MEKLGLKYAVSPVNGNRVTAYAPERYYDPVNGSFDWMAKQLDDEISQALNISPELKTGMERAKIGLQGPSTAFPSQETQTAMEKYVAPRAIVADSKTEAEIHSGRDPSYHVIYQRPDGRIEAMADANGNPLRFRFDPTADIKAMADRAEARRFNPNDTGMPEP